MSSSTVATIVGARPQFVKAAPVSRALRAAGVKETLIHTGQHYDELMSDVFFTRLGLGEPELNLGIGSGPHGRQTGRMIEAVEDVLLRLRPGAVLVYGDTNSTLAAALAAAKLSIPVAHVEAGLRSFNRAMPEELNRVLTDQLSSLLFTPTAAAVRNLSREGITRGVIASGDVMLDAARLFESEVGVMASEVPGRFGLTSKAFAFATVHRAENTDDPVRWAGILDGLEAVARDLMPVLWPAHPRTKRLLECRRPEGVTIVEPLPYFETQALLRHARIVLTDSGGLQKEAAFHRTPVVTLREETEWVELVECGVNRLAGADGARIRVAAVAAMNATAVLPEGLYGDGKAAHVVAREVASLLGFRDNSLRKTTGD